MGNYIGKPENGYPDSGALLPDDGVTDLDAKSVGVPFQRILDGLAAAKRDIVAAKAEADALALRSAQGLNWGPAVVLPDAVYAGTWDDVGLRWIVAGDRISASFDGFNFGTEYSTGGPYTDVAAFNGDIIVASAGRNIARSTGGWGTVDVFGAAATERAVVARSGGYWFWFGQDGQIKRSATGAAGTWTLVATLSGGDVNTRSLCVSPVTGTIIASVFDGSLGRTRMLRSVTSGESWETLATAVGPYALPEGRVTARMKCARKSGNKVTWMLTSTAPLRCTVDVSNDDGMTWQRVFTSFLTLVCGQAYTPNLDAGIWVAVDASTHQVIRSFDDGATWRYCNWRNPFAIPTLTTYQTHDVVVEGPNGLAQLLRNTGGAGAFAQGLRLSAAGGVAP